MHDRTLESPTVIPWRKAVGVAAWNLGLLAAGAAVVEAVFGAWLAGPSLGVLAVPRNVAVRHDVRALYGGDVAVYRRDGFGFRGSGVDPAAVDVLAVGGSTTAEFYVSEGETWVDVLAARFREAGAPLVFANAGVDGFSTVGHLRSFEVWFPRVPGLRPRWVLLYAGINELDLAHHERYDAAIEAGSGRKGGGARRAVKWLENQSALYALYRAIVGAIRARRVRLAHGAGPPPEVLPIVQEEPSPPGLDPGAAPGELDAMAAYQARLRELDRRIRGFGATPIIVTQTRGDARNLGGVLRAATPEALRTHVALARLNAAAIAVCREARAVCIDLAAEIEFRPGDFYDAVHTTPQGSRRIGEFLFGKLRATGTMPRQKRRVSGSGLVRRASAAPTLVTGRRSRRALTPHP